MVDKMRWDKTRGCSITIGAPHTASIHHSETHMGSSAASIHLHLEDSRIWLRFHIGAPYTASTHHSETHAGSLFKSYFTSPWHSPFSTMWIHSQLTFLTPPHSRQCSRNVLWPHNTGWSKWPVVTGQLTELMVSWDLRITDELIDINIYISPP